VAGTLRLHQSLDLGQISAREQGHAQERTDFNIEATVGGEKIEHDVGNALMQLRNLKTQLATTQSLYHDFVYLV
jgi:hypothetical protein